MAYYRDHNIPRVIIPDSISGVPYYNCSIMGHSEYWAPIVSFKFHEHSLRRNVSECLVNFSICLAVMVESCDTGCASQRLVATTILPANMCASARASATRALVCACVSVCACACAHLPVCATK